MLHLYLDYAVPHVNVHHNPDCPVYCRSPKDPRRISVINPRTISTELDRFSRDHYRFAPGGDLDFLWLDIDFEDTRFEESVAVYVLWLIARHYSPFRGLKSETHC